MTTVRLGLYRAILPFSAYSSPLNRYVHFNVNNYVLVFERSHKMWLCIVKGQQALITLTEIEDKLEFISHDLD